MRTVADYLDLTPAHALERAVLRAQPAPLRRRKHPPGPGIGPPPRRCDGPNRRQHHQQDAEPRWVARDGQAIEPLVYGRLLREPQRFRDLYLIVLRAAWQAGFSSEEVPDFLGLCDRDLVLLGQDEIGPSELSQAMREAERKRGSLRESLDVGDTERLVEQRTRVGQHRFARAVLQNYDWSCGFCGFQPEHLLGHKLIIASHIKPWVAATPSQRLDPRNGIAACPRHDAAFDTGLLTGKGGLRVHRAEPPGRQWARRTARPGAPPDEARWTPSGLMTPRCPPEPVGPPRHGGSPRRGTPDPG